MKTPQQLMDLPAYGMAEKELRNSKQWQLDPSEKLALIIDDIGYAISNASMSISGASDHLETLEEALEGNT